MGIEYARALFLTIVFMVVNFLTGVVFISFAQSADATGQLEKLLMGPPFVLGIGIVLWLFLAWFRPPAEAGRLLGLPAGPTAQGAARDSSLLTRIDFWIASALLFPAAFQILGAQLESLSRLVFDYPEWYAQLQALMSPKGSWIDLLGAALTLGIVGPICEELLFRGVVLGPLLARSRSRVAPVLFQATLFALIHMNPWQFAYALPMGALLGWLRLRSGSLWPPIALHCANNLLAMGLVYFGPPIDFLNMEPGQPIVHVPLPLLLAALSTGIAGVILIERAARRERATTADVKADATGDAV